ncbi:unnamed protein product, partial [Polarella glacialis]
DVEQPCDEDQGEAAEHLPPAPHTFLEKLVLDDVLQKFFPTFFLVCVSLATLEYLTDLRPSSYSLAPQASLVFESGVTLSVILFLWVALADPGKLPPRPVGRSGVEDLMLAIDSAAGDEHPPNFSRLCTTTWIIKGLRTKYCTQLEACIEGFDHYCIWLNTAIGRGNHRQFLCLALAESVTQLAHIWLCWTMALSFVPYESFFSWCASVVSGYPALAMMAFLQCMTAPGICILVCGQTYGCLANLTTNELINYRRYAHFWVTADGHKNFMNPFDKGDPARNCLDFWWWRRR